MRERRITCATCRSYDNETLRCRLGKANPRKKHEALTVAELMGPQMLCLHNPFREPLLLRMRQPKRRFVWNVPTAVPNEPLEVEILETEETDEEA